MTHRSGRATLVIKGFRQETQGVTGFLPLEGPLWRQKGDQIGEGWLWGWGEQLGGCCNKPR